MKILLISSIYPNKSNPIQGIYIKRVHDLYNELGYNVDLLVYEGGKNKIHKFFKMVKFLSKINKKIRTPGYDVINVQYPFIAAIPFRFIKLKTRLITTIHGSDINFNTYLKRWLGGFTVELLENSDLIIVNTRFFKKVVLNKIDIPAEKVKLSPSGGYDGNIFYPSNQKLDNCTDNDSDKIYWIGFAARLVERKGWRNILEAFLLLKQEEAFKNIGLMIAGDGPDFDKVKLEVELLEHKISIEYIKILGSLEIEELADFYRALDVFVFPTQFQESLGLVGVESLACGTPVIASDIGGIEEYMIEGVNGYLIEPSNTDSLVNALKMYLSLPEDSKEAMRLNAVNSVSHYEKTKVGETLERIFTQVTHPN